MATPRSPSPVLLVVAAFSRHANAVAWARQRLEREFGPVGLAGEPFPFDQTAYYGPTMGADLRKQLLAFRDLVAPERLAEIKLRTNALERELASAGGRQVRTATTATTACTPSRSCHGSGRRSSTSPSTTITSPSRRRR